MGGAEIDWRLPTLMRRLAPKRDTVWPRRLGQGHSVCRLKPWVNGNDLSDSNRYSFRAPRSAARALIGIIVRRSLVVFSGAGLPSTDGQDVLGMPAAAVGILVIELTDQPRGSRRSLSRCCCRGQAI
jgi:hypothetical protein